MIKADYYHFELNFLENVQIVHPHQLNHHSSKSFIALES